MIEGSEDEHLYTTVSFSLLGFATRRSAPGDRSKCGPWVSRDLGVEVRLDMLVRERSTCSLGLRPYALIIGSKCGPFALWAFDPFGSLSSSSVARSRGSARSLDIGNARYKAATPLRSGPFLDARGPRPGRSDILSLWGSGLGLTFPLCFSDPCMADLMKQVGLPICLSKNTPPNEDAREVGDSYHRAGDGATRG